MELEKSKVKLSRAYNDAGLTEAQEAFARLMAWNPSWTLTDCYVAAYPNFGGSHKTAGEQASRLWAKPKVKRRVEALRDAFSAVCPLTRGEALGILAGIARDGTEASRLRIDAIRQLQTMIPAWQAKPVNEIPQSIAIQIVAPNRASSNTEILVDVVDDVIEVDPSD